MAKKETNLTKEIVAEGQIEQANTEQAVVSEGKPVAQKAVVNEKADKKKVKKEKKPNKLVKMGKESISELKKVTWPTFRNVVKQTSIVLAVVLVFGIVLFGIDQLLTVLFKLLISKV